MAIVRVTTAFTAVPGGTGGSTITLPATSHTTGNCIVVFTRDSTLIPSTITDTAGNTYTKLAENTTQDPHMSVWIAKNITGNASNVISLNFSGSTAYVWGYSIEYSGLDASSPEDTYGTNTQTATTDCQSSSLSTAQSSEVLIMAASQPALTTYTAGTDFTLIEGSIGSGGMNFGGIEEYITSGALSSYTAHITAADSATPTTCWVALKAAGGGGGGFIDNTSNILLNVVGGAL
jgi:hypothetical protein